MSEERLRELLHSTTPEPPVSVSLDAVRERVSAPKPGQGWVMPTMAAAAVAAIATGVFAIAGPSGSGRPNTGGSAPTTASASTAVTTAHGEPRPTGVRSSGSAWTAKDRLDAAMATFIKSDIDSYKWAYTYRSSVRSYAAQVLIERGLMMSNQITPANAPDPQPRIDNMLQLFDIAAAAIGPHNRVDVQYDPSDGHLTRLTIEPTPGATGAEVSYTVTSFIVISHPDTPAVAEQRNLLQAARTKWASEHITDYRWSYTSMCFCPTFGVTVQVTEGKAGKPTVDRDPSRPAGEEVIPFLTMEQMFDWIGQRFEDSDQVTAEYDPTTGAVRSVNVDRIKNAVDDEVQYEVLSMVTPTGGWTHSDPTTPAAKPS